MNKQLHLLFKVYWQPALIALLGVLVLFQMYSWSASITELNKVETMLDKASDTDSNKEDQSGEGSEGSNPPGRPGPGGNGGNSRPEQREPERNIFKETKHNYKLTAIYLDKAVINGNPFAVGSKIGNATLTHIGVDSVTIQEEGNDQPKVIQLFQGGGSGPVGPGMSRSSGSSSRPSGKPSPSRPAPSVRSAPDREREPGPPPARVARRREMMDRFRSMSSEQRQEIAERMRSMSPEERREYIQRMR